MKIVKAIKNFLKGPNQDFYNFDCKTRIVELNEGYGPTVYAQYALYEKWISFKDMFGGDKKFDSYSLAKEFLANEKAKIKPTLRVIQENLRG